jgi:hypothetical protein
MRDWANHEAGSGRHRAACQRYMRRNALAVWADDRQGTAFGVSWDGPFIAPTLTSQASALDLLTTQIP